MVLHLIKKKIKNDDIALHIYNLYLISKYYEKGLLTEHNTNLFLFKFSNDEYYTNLILSKINFNNYNNNNYIKKIITNENIALKILIKNPNIIKNLDYTYKNNKTIISNICLNNSYYFKFASKELKNNINFILYLLEINIFIYFFIDDNLKNNNDIIKIIKINPLIIDLLKM